MLHSCNNNDRIGVARARSAPLCAANYTGGAIVRVAAHKIWWGSPRRCDDAVRWTPALSSECIRNILAARHVGTSAHQALEPARLARDTGEIAKSFQKTGVVDFVHMAVIP